MKKPRYQIQDTVLHICGRACRNAVTTTFVFIAILAVSACDEDEITVEEIAAACEATWAEFDLFDANREARGACLEGVSMAIQPPDNDLHCNTELSFEDARLFNASVFCSEGAESGDPVDYGSQNEFYDCAYAIEYTCNRFARLWENRCKSVRAQTEDGSFDDLDKDAECGNSELGLLGGGFIGSAAIGGSRAFEEICAENAFFRCRGQFN